MEESQKKQGISRNMFTEPERPLSYGTMEEPRLQTEVVCKNARLEEERLVLNASQDFATLQSLDAVTEYEAEEEPALEEKNPHLITEGTVPIDLLMLYTLVIKGISVSLFPPFLPLEMEKQGYDTKYVGLILSAAPASIVLFGNQYASLSRGRKRFAFFVSNAVYAAIMMGFSLIMIIKPPEMVFVSIAVCLRAVQGFIEKFQTVIVVSIIIKNYTKEDKARATPIISFSYGFGMVLGPACGSFFYSAFGYHGPFVFSFLTFLVALPLFYRILPEKVDLVTERSAQSSDRTEQKSEFWTILGEPQLAIMFSLVIFAGASFFFANPILAMRLEHHYELNLLQVSNTFTILPFALVMGTFVHFKKYRKVDIMTNKKLIVISCFFVAVALMLQGPSWVFPDEYLILCAGHVLLGLVFPFFRSPMQLVIEDKVVEIFGTEKKNDLAETLSTLLALSFAFSQFVGYTLGIVLMPFVGFRSSFEIMGVIIAVNTFAYLIFGKAYQVFLS